MVCRPIALTIIRTSFGRRRASADDRSWRCRNPVLLIADEPTHSAGRNDPSPNLADQKLQQELSRP